MNRSHALRKLISNLPHYAGNWLEWMVVLGESSPSALLPQIAADRPDAKSTKRRSLPISRYVVSSLLLHNSYRHLTEGREENLHFVTGVVVAESFVLTDMITVRGVDRRMARATAAAPDVHRAMVFIESFGLKCGALWHSHPGTRVDSTRPSGVDWRNQKAWEKAYSLLGAVFSRDGFVRFFAARPGVVVHVHGKKVTRIAENVYKLEVQ